MTDKETMKELILDALFTDGAHHKQWYLERMLIMLGYDLEELKKELLEETDCEWDEGRAP